MCVTVTFALLRPLLAVLSRGIVCGPLQPMLHSSRPQCEYSLIMDWWLVREIDKMPHGHNAPDITLPAWIPYPRVGQDVYSELRKSTLNVFGRLFFLSMLLLYFHVIFRFWFIFIFAMCIMSKFIMHWSII